MEKKTPAKEIPKKPKQKVLPKVEETKVQDAPAAEPQQESAPTPKPEPVKSLTLAGLQTEIESIKLTISEHNQKLADLESALARKRKPPISNGKVQIIDKKTGQVFPSKNNAYQSLLKSGELKELVDKGIFGTEPEKNSFGWYALVRAWPDRFEEVKAEQSKEQT